MTLRAAYAGITLLAPHLSSTRSNSTVIIGHRLGA